jgi:hypothetical protein
MEIRSAKFPIPTAVLIAAIYLLLNTGCARIADPQPPKILIPKSAADLTAYQLANSIVISVSMPDQNTDGSPITTLQRVDIFRIEEESVADTIESPLSEKQFLTQASRIQSISKAQFPDYLHDKTFILRDEPKIPPEASFYTLAFRYAVAFVNNKGQAAGLSNQVTIQPVPIPPPPEGISGEITESAIQLKWAPPPNMDGSKPAAIEGYNIYRSEQPEVFPSIPINPLPVKQTEFEDHRFQFNKTYYYAVTTIGSLRNPFAESLRSKVLPLETRDIFPPVPPKDLNALFEKSMVILLWAPSSSSDVAGYRITRQEQGATTPQLLQQELITSLSFRDNNVEMGKRYEYSIQAIDSSGNESSAVRVEVQTQ